MGPRRCWSRTATVVLAVGLASCGRTGTPAAGERRVPVVLVSVDTLRADHLPSYGATAVDTPAIDALARDAILFERAFSHAPATLPSHASILTGTLPGEHGLRDNARYSLRDGVPTMAQLLAGAGYRTGGFVSAYPLRPETGIDAGFDRYDARLQVTGGGGIGEIRREGGDTLRAALSWLRARDERTPFLFLHLFEPHQPYAPPEDLRQRYGDTYEAEIAASDRLLGRLVAALRAEKLYDDALIIFLSDHGEGLGDHGEEDHGLFVYTSTLHVPLLVKLPAQRRAGERVAVPAELIDVLPTVLAVTRIGAPPRLAGRSLLDLRPDTPPRRIYSETYMPRLEFGWSELLSLIEFPYQYIDAPDPELYDLSRDPDEERSLALEQPARLRAMEQSVAAMEVPLDQPATVDRAARDRLMALGYVGAGRHEETLADPKSKLHLLRHLKTAASLFFADRLEEAVEEYESTLKEDPGLLTAWEFLGRTQLRLERFDDAVTSFETLLALGGDDAMVDRTLAQLYARTGRHDEAAVAARRALADRPNDAASHQILADAMLSGNGDLDEALAHAERAVALADKPLPGGQVVRGRVLARMNRPDEAAAAFRTEIDLFPANLQAYRQLAALRFQTGDADAGTAVLETMVARNPGPLAEAWAIQILAEAGRARDAEAWRRRAATRHPNEAAFTEAPEGSP